MLHYSYLNVVLTPLRSIVLDTDNTYLEHPGSAAADKFYWRRLYERHAETISGPSFVLRSPANNYYHTLLDNLPRLYAIRPSRRLIATVFVLTTTLSLYFGPFVLGLKNDESCVSAMTFMAICPSVEPSAILIAFQEGSS